MKKKVIIVGGAGMDYHVFNEFFRKNREYQVVAFTMAAEQNLGTTNAKLRSYPKKLAGYLYKHAIPTIPESELSNTIKKLKIDVVVLAYSDVSHEKVMHVASEALAAGANFMLIAPDKVMIESRKPMIAVTAVRTGCGKSQLSKYIMKYLKDKGLRVVAIREPMPYGDLEEQTVMRFEKYSDLDKYKCTVEEREEYEQYIEDGYIIYSGVDYAKILKKAEKEADVIIWDGGNNEISFYVPDVLFVIADPLRAGDELTSHPGEVNFRLADYIVINKENTAKKQGINTIVENAKKINPKAKIVHANSIMKYEEPSSSILKTSKSSKQKKPIKLRGKKVIIVEDGPTTTHGGLDTGAATVYAKKVGAKIINPQKYLTGSIKKVYKEFPHLKTIIPAMGYSKQQLKDLENTLNKAKADYILSGSPINLGKLIKTNKPIIRIRYEIQEKNGNKIKKAVDKVI